MIGFLLRTLLVPLALSCAGKLADTDSASGNGGTTVSQPGDFDSLPPLYKNPTRVSLEPVESCEQLLDKRRKEIQSYVDDANKAYKAMKDACASQGRTASSCYYATNAEVAVAADAGGTITTLTATPDSGSTVGATKSLEAGKDYSTTNTQEAGVDEADFVKTDGDYLYILSGTQLVIVSARPAEATREIVRVEPEGYPNEMYLKGDRLAVFSATSRGVQVAALSPHRGLPGPLGKVERTAPVQVAALSLHRGLPGPLGKVERTAPVQVAAGRRSIVADGSYTPSTAVTKVTLYDISDRAAPAVLRETYLDGAYSTSRRIDGRIFLVLALPDPWSAAWYQAIRFDPKADPPYTLDASKLTVENFVPMLTDKTYGENGPSIRTNVALDCRQFLNPTLPAGLGYTTVFSVPMDDTTGDIGFSSVVGTPGIAYASRRSLYITQYDAVRYGIRTLESASSEEPQERLLIHKFDLSSDPLKPVYEASGSVQGHLVDQFSLGEHRGVLRVATTVGEVWRSGDGSARNNVFVLQSHGSELTVVGEIRDFARSEKIYSARFIGDRGFVVTFKKVDPLFTMDLTDPAHPRMAGELKVPGYSTYLQPLDEGHLLAIGKDADDRSTFAWYQGVQLSIFDVTNLDEPKLQHKEIIGTRGTESEALDEHKAFNYFAPKNLLTLPIAIFEGGQGGSSMGRLTFSGHRLYRVTLEKGFELLGSVDHADFLKVPECVKANYSWAVNPKRSVVIEDFVYTISDLGMKVTSLLDPGQTPVSLSLPTRNATVLANVSCPQAQATSVVTGTRD